MKQQLKIANHLSKEYTTDGYNVTPIDDYSFKFKDKDIVIPKEAVIVVPMKHKTNRDLVIRCVKKISHPFILKLVDDYQLTLSDYTIVQTPDNKDLWGYSTVNCKDTEGNVTEGDGEVHDSNLNSGMKGYAYTMLRKRAEDRAVLRYFGLYQKGFYAETEDIGENDKNEAQGSVDYDSAPTRSLSKENNPLSEIQQAAKNRGLSKDQVEEIAFRVLNITTEEINWKNLVASQLEEVKNAILKVEDDAPDEKNEQQNEEEVQTFKEAIKQYKIEQDWDNNQFIEEVKSVLEIDNVDFNTLTKTQLESLYKKFILND